MQLLVDKSRQIDQDDVPRKNFLCSYLGIDVAAITGEGFVTYDPGRKTLLDALRKTRVADLESLQNDRPWRLYSSSLTTTKSLRLMGVEVSAKDRDSIYSFLSASSTRAVEASTR